MNINARSKPDLTISTIRPTNPSPRAGEEVDFDLVVRNDGKEDAGPFNLYLEAGRRFRRTRRFPGLEAGKQMNVSMGPWETERSGPADVMAEVDSSNEVAESSETNNFKHATVFVRN